MNNKVSIISPAYNVEKYIEKCLQSVICQSYVNFEHIIIDDGSTDCTPAILDKYSRKDNRIRVVHLPKSGVTEARKTGIEMAEGNYVYFLDSDDYLQGDALFDLVNHNYYQKSEIVVGAYTEIELSGKLYYHNYESSGPITSDEYISLILRSSNQGLCGKLFKRDLFKNHISYPSDLFYGEDFLLLIQIVSFANKICFLSKSVFFYVRRETSLTNSNLFRINHLYYDRALYLDSIIDNLRIQKDVRSELIEEVIKELYPYSRKNKKLENYSNVRGVLRNRFKDTKARREIKRKKWNHWLYLNVYLNAPFLLVFYNLISRLKSTLNITK